MMKNIPILGIPSMLSFYLKLSINISRIKLEDLVLVEVRSK